MYSTSKWAVEPVQVPELVEFPRMLLWKRTVFLATVGISIGLGTGYLLGRSTVAKTEAVNSVLRPPLRAKFCPIPDTDPGEVTSANNDGEAVQTWMPPAADSPGAFAEDLPPRRKARPALIRLENASPRNSDRG
jgi:hypothetical protein